MELCLINSFDLLFYCFTNLNSEDKLFEVIESVIPGKLWTSQETKMREVSGDARFEGSQILESVIAGKLRTPKQELDMMCNVHLPCRS